MGRYVPPEHEGTLSANKLAGKHALGARARKSGQGILTVRFEMPFAIWCTTCPKPTIIGQGVRFNAEKKKVGNYHSTSIFSFRMRHNVCGGPIEIRTDPKNTAYVVWEGAKKRDTGEGKEGGEGEIVVRTEEERERLREDAFAALEVKVDDRRQQNTDKTRIEELQDVKEKNWEDPYMLNKRLRRAFRADRKMRQGKEKITEALRERMGLGIELLDETEEDRRRAGFVEFGAVDGEAAMVKARSKPLFPEPVSVEKPQVKKMKPTKAETAAQQRREELRKELGTNTRAALDPFLSNGKSTTLLTRPSTIVKKKEDTSSKSADLNAVPTNHGTQQLTSSLVDYDSD